MQNITFTQEIVNEQFLIKMFSPTALSGTGSWNIEFTYTADNLSFDTIRFPGSSSTSISAGITGAIGQVTISGSASLPTSPQTPIASIIFDGNGSGIFDLDFTRLTLNREDVSYTDPPEFSYDITPQAMTTNLVMAKNTQYSDVFDPYDSFFGPSLKLGNAPLHGTVELGGDIFSSKGSWSYTPSAAYSGSDTFRITATDSGKTKDLLVTVSVVAPGGQLTGTSQEDIIIGSNANETLKGLGGNDQINAGGGVDTAIYSYGISRYAVTKTGPSYAIRDTVGTEGTDTITNVERINFSDKTINLTVQERADSISVENLNLLKELYIAFFNRIPDADGLEYWIGQIESGQSINQIAEAFYNAGVQYSDLTGFSSTMSDADFVNVIYKNVLGRTDGADTEGLAYWSGALANGSETRGSLVSSILGSAHTFKGDATWGWVADLLDNKIAVAELFAIDLGLNYNNPSDSIEQGMAIAAAVTPTSIDAAIDLIGVSFDQINLT